MNVICLAVIKEDTEIWEVEGRWRVDTRAGHCRRPIRKVASDILLGGCDAVDVVC